MTSIRKKIRLSLTIDADLIDDLDGLALSDERSRSAMAQKAIRLGVDCMRAQDTPPKPRKKK